MSVANILFEKIHKQASDKKNGLKTSKQYLMGRLAARGDNMSFLQ